MKVLLAKKAGMTQFFDENMEAHAVTILAMAEVTVVGLKTKEKDGYTAVVVGYGSQKAHRVAKPQVKQYSGSFSKVKEFRMDDISSYSLGQVLGVDSFTKGDVIAVSGISKGKGFQGVVKRHGFKGKGPIHNVHHALREPGSIGGGGRAGGRVVKGMKMAGRMGADRITVQNLNVVAVDATTKTMLVKGAVPGNPGGIIEVVGN
jgi:large subunit ribosomal protein L3